MELLKTFIIVSLSVAAYILPTIIASKRHHKMRTMIMLLNVMGGWTIIGWLTTLFWALSKNIDEQPQDKAKPKSKSITSAIRNFEINTPNKKIAVFSGGFSIAMLLMFLLIGAPPNTNTLPDGSKNEKLGAAIMCQSFVENSLKSPQSAKFPLTASKAQYLGTNKYILSSYVDSQNSYGAMIRSNFDCIVYRNNENNNWELLQLNIK